jgi:alanyl-tRNA synthetase
MTHQELRQKFFKYFTQKGHKEIPSSPLVPENDPSILLITAGMHPLVPFLLGELHPEGKRLVNIQKCIRTDDIDEIGDITHLTFFEMMGYWSLGDYLKEESIRYTYDFFVKELGIDPQKISVTVFAGDKDIPRDEESAGIWQKEIGIPKEKIYFLPKEDNFWPAKVETGPCGPDTEMFYEIDFEKCGPGCKPGCSCGKYVEIANNVFMEYNKNIDGTFEPLKQKNVDVGMGLERIIMVLQNKESVFETDLFSNIKKEVEKLAQNTDNEKAIRIICDHLRASTFLLVDNVVPSNLEQGYILRRLIRRAIRYGKIIGIQNNFTAKIIEAVISQYQDIYPELQDKKEIIIQELNKEEQKFEKTLEKGIKEFEKIISGKKIIDGSSTFKLYDTYGFPIELTEELANEKGIEIDKKEFQRAFKKHQELSRKGTEKKFKGGLADQKEKTIKLHTAAHLLLQSLREVLGDHVLQRGSNITVERLRFDFSHPEKMTNDEIKKVEMLVNQKINEGLPVTCQEMNFDEAKKKGAMGVFEKKYSQKVKVYYIGRPNLPEGFFSQEICGGPHVKNTGKIGHFKIIKEQSSSAGIRRIKAIIE